MAVAATRFKFLDQQTNLATSDLVRSASSQILNSPQRDVLEVTAQLSALIDGNKFTDVKGILSTIARATLSATGITKNFFTSRFDSSMMSSSEVDVLTNNMFSGNARASASFKVLGAGCRSSILGILSNLRNAKIKAWFNGKFKYATNRSCLPQAFAALINAITGGSYKASIVDQLAVSRMIAAVSIRGFQIGLPNVFSSLTGQISDQHVLTQTGNMVIGNLAQSGDMYGIMDVANSSIGSLIKSVNPGIVKQALSNFKLPSDVNAGDLTSFYSGLSGSLNNLDPTWDNFNLSNGASILSAANMPLGNSDFSSMYKGCLSNFTTDISSAYQGIVSGIPDEGYLYAGLGLGQGDAMSALSNDFADISISGSDNSSDSYTESFYSSDD
jgi:hypothetical protein